ncbi:hypothetical protein M409DRAFT_64039 [Zasmidium cellare ATCC 36951]|uniref:Glycoside hydrolase family 105 protein n=1 Tax=Zasmidium cellare ATCC 36951 TaxID=1080233 RepID=A0A6A6CZ25_ZASCE|nr:uncharacterized protein M409DRAFT_64039 [Zasmidium cellare ATCC 36951]KAF2171069.1 hypothetical protein M409DRAFT_64039 [Zasmidium cellare ATCC 36951]
MSTFNHSFVINAATEQAHDEAVRSWEVAYAFEATQQVFNPERSVFGSDPFPDGKIPSLGLRLDEASLFAEPKLKPQGKVPFKEEKNAVSDRAAVGIAALMLSQKWGNKDLMEAATRQKDILLNEAPRYSNGAISHVFGEPQLWSDAIAMFPPFLAYYGVATEDLDLIREAVRQIALYRDVLRISAGRTKGLWRHVVGSTEDADEGAWSTGNAWVAYGMARVRATITAWPTSNAALSKEKNDLDTWIAEILSGAVITDDDSSGLLRNYLGDSTWSGETSGTALLAAAAYRMALLRPEIFAKDTYLDWMHRKRRAVIQRVDNQGIVRPAVNPLKPKSKTPFTGVSPEGESFLLLLSTAWRDCKDTGARFKKEAQPQKEPVENPGANAQERAFFYIQGVQREIEDFVKPYLKPFAPLLDYLAPP